MTLVLPSTVEELNQLQHSFQLPSSKQHHHQIMQNSFANKGFENIAVERRYKREVSLPNGVADWNISNFDSYLNFEENNCPKDDRLVPSDVVDSSHFSSDSSVSSMDDRRLLFPSAMGLKTFSTVCVDSGSTCIAPATDSGASYLSENIFGLDVEETYQNLDLFLQPQQVPELPVPSPLSVGSSNSSSYDLPCLSPGGATFPLSQDTLTLPQGIKRPVSTSSEDDVFAAGSSSKRPCPSPQQYAVRRGSGVPPKNCRKTRKEKQKEMEQRMVELEKEKEGLRVEVQVLEELINAHKRQLYAILQKR